LIPALQHLQKTLSQKAVEFDDVPKTGRTHLMDAMPVRLGQEFGGFAAQIELSVERLKTSCRACANFRWGARRSARGSIATRNLVRASPQRWPKRQIGRSTRLNSSHVSISYAVFCMKKK